MGGGPHPGAEDGGAHVIKALLAVNSGRACAPFSEGADFVVSGKIVSC